MMQVFLSCIIFLIAKKYYHIFPIKDKRVIKMTKRE